LRSPRAWCLARRTWTCMRASRRCAS
jgi:hypothetical protein